MEDFKKFSLLKETPTVATDNTMEPKTNAVYIKREKEYQESINKVKELLPLSANKSAEEKTDFEKWQEYYKAEHTSESHQYLKDKASEYPPFTYAGLNQLPHIIMPAISIAMDSYAEKKLQEYVSTVAKEKIQEPEAARKEAEEVFGGLRDLIKDDAIYHWYLELIIQYKLNR